ncbi:MAG: PAS domain-containing protein, partial [Oscillospiraceae bacterium]|nr:PAS domain-containing protein [Oscillospiraceae bacterium]
MDELQLAKMNLLERESSMLQTMFDSISDLIFCKDANLNYTRCNKSLLQYFGLEEDELIGKGDADGLRFPFETAEEYRAMDREVMNSGKIFTYEEFVPDANGVSRLFETNKAPLLINGKITGVMGIARDITERKAMEEIAQNANRAKSSFLAHMSHEMRTPMNSIIGFSELALDAEIPQKTREYLNLIIDNSKWLLQLINDILDISKIESGNMKLEQIPFDLHEIFIACRTLIAPKAAEKNIDLFFYAEPFV